MTKAKATKKTAAKKAAPKKSQYELFDRHTQSFIYNNQVNATQRMLDFDYASGRESPSVAAIINPTGGDSFSKFFFGNKEILIPSYKSLEKAAKLHPNVDVMINFASFRSAAPSTEDALDIPQLKTVVIIAEGVPERRMKLITAKAKKLGKNLIGPATVGGIKAGCFKIGNTGGTIDNIVDSKLHRPGSVGFVSKSGGLSNEAYNTIARNTDGLYEGIAIGGDMYPGSSLLDHLLRYEKIPDVKMLVCLGEVGGSGEYDIVEAMRKKQITKPLVMWVTGTCSKAFKTEVQFGHAGAKAGSEAETADAKNAALKKAGAIVPNSYDDYDQKIRQTYEKLVKNGTIKPKPEPPAPKVPMDYAKAVKEGLIRKPANFISTISDDRGEELEYGGIPISKVFKDDMGIGGVLSILWFKRQFPAYASKFIEMTIMVTADHGPAVSGAHNAIVTARAGKDLISSIVSGMLTIGPRFGGAIDGAAQMFSDAYDRGLTPQEFVNEMKKKGVNIQGIGHRVKSIHNPDMRVTIISQYAKKNFKKTPLLDFALEVEKITTSKRDNLILNVDGCIGICFADMLRNEMQKKEADEYIQMGALNGLFILGRTIGMMGHYLDQKRLKQGLYRHPWDDILYLKE
ncbi:MAG: ATP citrate synthase [Candidatus Thermoplasmatota archaeon]|nr:ATP citrate synthase [Euryarchaeota archaeon]MBU4031712.1 ATP citrate synthase [Candidatus Thermoplasmatota archaeon]MBU4071288.1 ATP citrate synthase [Candidatus Thermoplasmatota archaeon]MBU4145205.1 ATP citrate synthase [Candidatus Thermoplasmatota archaeon]MBU4592196.1 ATP citrate synthase [Candidatus Thermoplasmatota archaeon]